MGGYFDLNIPYNESTTNKPPASSSSKTVRLKQAVKAIHLGYSGIAYNRTIKGVMSESHRCSTPPFPLSSLLKLSPSLSSSVSLHRNALGVHPSSPFRQFTRLTVVADTPPQVAALNSGNPVLKSYDVVAVRPTNQQTFEQACTSSEVDLISIDFEQLHFRLKQHMVKAAIERGIYFEIAYSALLLDAQLRRQMITSAKLLVDWTRGKNLIISSASPSVTEMRGPYDVANLSSLLGLSMENAKAALSKNCRSLLAKAMRKKHYYKDTIRVEIIPSGEEFDSNENWPKDWMKWDPISSGEGDLFLDDMAKSFCAANKVSNTLKPIDFASIIDKSPSHRLQVKKLIPVTDEPNKLATSFFDSFEGQDSLHINPSRDQSDSSKDFIKLNPSTHTEGDMSNDEKTVSHTDYDLETRNDLDELGVRVSSLETENLCLQSENYIRKCDTQVVDHIEKTDSSLMEIDISDAHEAISEVDLGSQNTNMKSITTDMNIEIEQSLLPTTGELIYTDNGNLKELTAVSDDITDTLLVEVSVDDEYENDHTAMKEFSIVTDKDLKGNRSQTFCEIKGENLEMKDVDVALPVLVSHDEINGSSQISVISEPLKEVVMEKQKENDVCAQSSSPVILSNSSSGKRKRKIKPGVPNQACVFPFKRLLNCTPFKRKSNKHKAQSKLL